MCIQLLFDPSTYANPKSMCYPNTKKFDFFLLVMEVDCKKTKVTVAQKVEICYSILKIEVDPSKVANQSLLLT